MGGDPGPDKQKVLHLPHGVRVLKGSLQRELREYVGNIRVDPG